MARIARITGGLLLLLAGLMMLVLPGPGILTIAAALAVLAKDIPAAARLKDWVKAKFIRVPDDVDPVGDPPEVRNRVD
jgi:hypothetical protein